MVDFVYKESYNIDDFRDIIAILRGDGGCVWDREQTHQSIRRNLLEEAYEVCEAIDNRDTAHLKEELGDLLMQILFHSRIEEESGSFCLDDVADAACKKLISRHPHVFGSTTADSVDDVLSNWDELKRIERSQDSLSSVMDGIARSLPALMRAEKLQLKAKKAGFDWPDISGALEKLSEEKAELEQAIKDGDNENAFEELGDLLFCAVNVGRFFCADPEDALNACCEKFIRRYRGMEELARTRGLELSSLELDAQEELYQIAKHQ